eukprot:gene31374-38753_t
MSVAVLADTDASDLLYIEKATLNGTAATNSYAQALNYCKTHPTRDAQPTAIDAYHHSTIISMDPNSAPSGALHYWNIGSAGHVAMATTQGWAMMASCHVTESWGDCIGQSSVNGYTSLTGAKYLGWAYDYSRAEILDFRKPGPTPGPSGLPRTTTADDGVPGTNYYKRQQYWASKFGYTGPIDGVLGVKSWAGTQRALRDYGYSGPDDGVPGTQTYMAMQRLAARNGYTGPIDGVLGVNSYKGVGRFLNTL